MTNEVISIDTTDAVVAGGNAVARKQFGSAAEYARHDYARFIAEYGIDEVALRIAVESTDDQIDYPHVYARLELLPSAIDGIGLFTRELFFPEDIIAFACVDGKRTPAGRYVNHSPTPNARNSLIDGDGVLIASKFIQAGEEITIDYRTMAQWSGMLPIEAEVASTMRQKIEVIENEWMRSPIESPPLRHFFGDGIYAREMRLPKGQYFTGRIHKYAQINILSKGDITVLTPEGVVRVQAPYTVVCPAGSKRIGYAHDDCVWTTILRTDLTDPDECEDELTAASEAEYRAFIGQELLEVSP